MYHDQGLIPLKLLHFMDGVNVTLGLPIIRTSVDHGTAYDLAGTGEAIPGEPQGRHHHGRGDGREEIWKRISFLEFPEISYLRRRVPTNCFANLLRGFPNMFLLIQNLASGNYISFPQLSCFPPVYSRKSFGVTFPISFLISE